MRIEEIKTVKRQYEKEWLKIPEVVAVGVGQTRNGQTGIMVSVSKISDNVKSKIPPSVGGIPVEIIETGMIKAL